MNKINDKKMLNPNIEKQKSADSKVMKDLVLLYTLQHIDTQIDKLRIIRGELPLEVQDLEDDIEGKKTRKQNVIEKLENCKKHISNLKLNIIKSLDLINKYEEQLQNVRNNREYDSLMKEIEYQKLEIQHYEKMINENNKDLDILAQELNKIEYEIEQKKLDLEEKRKELEEITAETAEDEKKLLKYRSDVEMLIEKRLILSYEKLKKKARNGLAVVSIERDACGGCFNRIPLQRQYEIRTHKAILVCEYCGRILVDDAIVESSSQYIKEFSL